MWMQRPLTQAMKGLAKFGPDGLVFSVVALATFGALILKADPVWSVGAGCGFCILWLIRNFVSAHLDVHRKRTDLQIKAQTQALAIAKKAGIASAPSAPVQQVPIAGVSPAPTHPLLPPPSG